MHSEIGSFHVPNLEGWFRIYVGLFFFFKVLSVASSKHICVRIIYTRIVFDKLYYY